ncbi:MAG TPA: beta-propeller domain-containing protein [Candidatus Stackebrandtia excrementipullorum]|nr:beta-propeller domain-containing protein [Candidatus Stackebrandtia excrementipullorum]
MSKLKSVIVGIGVAAVTAGCSATVTTTSIDETPPLSGALTSFASCDEALAELRANAAAHTPPMGWYPPEVEAFAEDAPAPTGGNARGNDPAIGGDEYSGTNTHETGVDEPDIVKTDGRRVVTAVDGVVRIVDAASGEAVGTVALDESVIGMSDLLLFGDRALVVTTALNIELHSEHSTATTVYLVDLAGQKVLNRFTIEGDYLDARAVDGVVRVVVRSQPVFVPTVDGDRRGAVMRTPIDSWLPDYELDGEGGQIACTALARPTEYSGTSLLTLLTFDMEAGLDDGTPVTVAADGNTVYGTGDALYIANDRGGFATVSWDLPVKAETELYRFGLGRETAPVLDASGAVPGYLLNQYSMSEWNGHLRVATTDSSDLVNSSSSVYMLEIGDGSLTEVGRVEGLGLGERIYAVRYVGDAGYVVTFRQVDPLYVLDLRDPAAPKALGELKITGYSSYLHPVSDTRLLGVGQEADDSGRTQGTQISLFDVSDASNPTRLDQYHVPGSSTSVEIDPHAFLYWPGESIAVIPVQEYGSAAAATVVSVGDTTLSELATVEVGSGSAVRNLVIGEHLWTFSHDGYAITTLSDFETVGWFTY